MRWVAATVAAAVLGVGAWILVAGPSTTPRPRSVDLGDEAALPARREALPGGAAAVIATDPLAEPSGRGGGEAVLGVTAPDGSPAAGSRVSILDAASLALASGEDDLIERAIVDGPLLFGAAPHAMRREAADARGAVALGPGWRELWCVAEDGTRRSRWTRLGAEDGAAPPVLQLEEGLAVDVLVRDPDGAPLAGILVALVEESGLSLRRAITDRGGRARLAIAAGERSRESSALGVVPVLPVRGVSPVPVKAGPGGEASAILRLPRLDSLQVQLVAEKGSPVDGPVLVEIDTDPAALELDDDSFLAARCSVFALVAGGGFTLEGVAPELALDVRAARLPGFWHEGESRSEAVAGRGRPSLVVPLALEVPVLLGVPIAPSGGVLPRARFAVELVVPGREEELYASQVVASDGLGRLFVPIDFTIWDGCRNARLRGRLIEAEGADLGSQGPRFEVPVPPITAGIVDVGRLALAEQPLVVSGRVVDEKGRPIAGAVLYPSVESTPPGEPAFWSWLDDLEGTTDAEGRFEIRLSGVAGRLRIDVVHRAFVWRRFGPFLVGAEGEELVLRRGGAVEAEILLDPDLDKLDLRFTMVGPPYPTERGLDDGLDPEAAVVAGERSASGHWSWEGLHGGEWRLECRVRVHGNETTEALASVAGIAVVEGTAARDARLHPLDLRGRIPSFGITVLDHRGSVLPEARVAFEGGGVVQLVHDGGARYRVVGLTGGKTAKVAVWSADRATVVREICAGATTVVLGAPRPPVRVRFVLSPALAAARSVHGSLCWIPEGWSVPLEGRMSRPVMMIAADAEVLLPEPGRYLFSTGLLRADDARALESLAGARHGDRFGNGIVVVVPDTTGVAEVTIPVERAHLSPD